MTVSLLRAASLLAVALALSGCSGLRLYSETRDKQGQAAVKAWGEVDLKADFKADAAQREAQLTRELATSDQRLASERELVIRHLASARSDAFPALVDAEIDRLFGTRPDTRVAALDAVNALQANADLQKAKRDQLARSLSFLQERNAPDFTCKQLLKPSDDPVQAWRQREPTIRSAGRISRRRRSPAASWTN